MRSLQYHFVHAAPMRSSCAIHRSATYAGGEYNQRVAECEAGVAGLARARPGLRSLRDADMATLEAGRRYVSNTIFRLCRHVITENERVRWMAAALERGDLGALGPLMAESHWSLRDDYNVSSPELDLLVELAGEAPGVVGSRMTGAGFGGARSTSSSRSVTIREQSAKPPSAVRHQAGHYVTQRRSAAGRIRVEGWTKEIHTYLSTEVRTGEHKKI